MSRRTISLAVKLGIVGLIFLEHIVNGGQEHPGDGDDCLFMPTAFFKIVVTVKDFGVFFPGFDCGKSALDEQRFDVDPGPADPGSFWRDVC